MRRALRQLPHRVRHLPASHWVRLTAAAAAAVLGWLTTGPWHGLGLAVVCAVVLWPVRRVREWFKKHDDLAAWLMVATFVVYVGGAYLGRLQLATGYQPNDAERDFFTRYAQHWWLAHARGRYVLWASDQDRAIRAAGVLIGAYMGAALLRRVVAPDQPGDKRGAWHEPAVLTAALVNAGVLTKPKDGLMPRVQYMGRVRSDEYGTRVQLRLPQAKTLSDVQQRRGALASSLRVPLDRLIVSTEPDQAADVVQLWVGAPRPAIGSGERAPVATAASCDWGKGARLGRTPLGVPVLARTNDTHTLIVGAPDSGKTATARAMLAHAILDPSVKLWAANGKQEAADWEALAPLCEVFAGYVDETMPRLVQRMLAEFLAHAQAISRGSRKNGRAKPNAVLLIEEWGAIRNHCANTLSASEMQKLDNDLTTIVNTTRSAGCMVVLITQKPTSDSFPTKQKAGVVQRIVMPMGDESDARLGLGQSTRLPFPTRRGQCLIRNGNLGPTECLVDYLSDEDWEAVCARGAALRGIDLAAWYAGRDDAPEGMDATLFDEDQPAPTREPEEPAGPVVPPVLAAIVAMLEEADQGVLTPAQVYAALPEELRPWPRPEEMGKALRKLHGLGSEPVNKKRVYQLADARAAVSRATESAVV